MTPKEYLSRYRWLDAEINAKLEQREELRRKAQTVGGDPGSGVRSSQPYDRVGEITARIVDLEREINEDIDTLVDLQREIRQRIAEIPDEKQRTVLELRYINCLPFNEIADRMYYSPENIFILHQKGLKNLQCIIV